MTRYSKYNIIYQLQKWMDSVPGQTFLNYAYSWGASVVILGTLFKLTHLPGANFFLFLGMGTEVFVFFISAFDRPFDKTADGMDLSTHLPETEDGTPVAADGIAAGDAPHVVSPFPAGATVAVAPAPEPVTMPSIDPEFEEVTNNYIEQLRQLTETLQAVGEQGRRLVRESEEMENLDRTLTSISRVYEMQLKSASQQVGAIDQINAQQQRMADQIAELNKIYARMIEAMSARAGA